MSSIVALCFKKKKVSVPAPFRHRYRFKSIDYVPVSDKNQTIPIPRYEAISVLIISPLRSYQSGIVFLIPPPPWIQASETFAHSWI